MVISSHFFSGLQWKKGGRKNKDTNEVILQPRLVLKETRRQTLEGQDPAQLSFQLSKGHKAFSFLLLKSDCTQAIANAVQGTRGHFKLRAELGGVTWL